MLLTARRALVACALVLTLGACAHQQPTEPGDIAAGRQIAETYCASCHAIGTRGESHHPMAPPWRTLSRNYPIESLQESFAEGVLVGHPDMPQFELQPAQIDDLLAYINSVQER